MLNIFFRALSEYEEAESRGQEAQAAYLANRLRFCWPPSFFAVAEKQGRAVPDYDRSSASPEAAAWAKPGFRVSYIQAQKMLISNSPQVAQA